MNSLVLTVEGIDCAGCAKSFANSLVTKEGIVDARYNIAYKKLYVDFNPEEISEEEIIDYITYSKAKGCFLTGTEDMSVENIKIVEES